MIKVFVDGQKGTTGLEIHARLGKRLDVEVISIDPELRKDLGERRKMLNGADIVFLCLPDDAAREAVGMIESPAVKVIDASTAHRIADGWAYGLPELSGGHRAAVEKSSRVAVPGCYATGFNALVYPLVREGILVKEHPVSCHAVTGFSGGGRELIEAYDDPGNADTFASPNFYALGQTHKHLPEMQHISGLTYAPVFSPIVANYYRGMTVAVPLHVNGMKKPVGAKELAAFYADYYANARFVRALPFGYEKELERGYLNATSGIATTNELQIIATGNDERVMLIARLDNLGKGASGAAVQNMNIMLGLPEEMGL